jgi:hypothetical protein
LAIALVAHTGASGTSSSVTTSAIDTTGATLLVIAVAYYNTPTISDNKVGNTWNIVPAASIQAPDLQTLAYYVCYPVSTGTNHTFTASGGGANYPALTVSAWSGTVTASAPDQTNKSQSRSPGSVLPSASEELVITAVTAGGSSSGGTSIDSGFTVLDIVNGVPGVAFSAAGAYKIQTTAATESPAWSGGTGSNPTSNIITLRSATGVATPYSFRAKPGTNAGLNRQDPLAKSLVIAYPLNEGGKTATIKDAVTQKLHNGTLNNFGFTATSGWTTGQLGRCLAFDGTDDYTLNTSGGINLGVCTMSAVFQIDALPGSTARICGFTQGNGGGTRDHELLVGSDGTLIWYGYDGGAKDVRSAAGAVTLGRPMHVCGTADGTNIKIYVNGTLAGTTACGQLYTGYSGNNVLLGGTGTGTYLAMKLYGFWVHSVALPASLVRTFAQDPFRMFRRSRLRPMAGPTATYPFPVGSFETPVAADYLQNSNANGGSWFFASGGSGAGGVSKTGGGYNVPSTIDGSQVGVFQNLGYGEIKVQVSNVTGTNGISFWLLGRHPSFGGVQSVRVSWDGVQIGSDTAATTAWTKVRIGGLTFTNGVHTLKIEGLNNSGDNTAFVDYIECTNATVTLIPKGFKSKPAANATTLNRSDPSATKIAAAYLFNEGAGPTVYDRAGGKRNLGTLTNFALSSGTPGWTNTEVGKALLFDGSDDYIALANNFTTNVNILTVAALVKPSAVSGIQTLLGSTSDGGLQFRMNATAMQFVRQGQADIGSSSAVITAGEWQVLMGAHNVTTGATAFWRNGIAVGTLTNATGLSYSSAVIGYGAAGGERLASPLAGLWFWSGRFFTNAAARQFALDPFSMSRRRRTPVPLAVVTNLLFRSRARVVNVGGHGTASRGSAVNTGGF